MEEKKKKEKGQASCDAEKKRRKRTGIMRRGSQGDACPFPAKDTFTPARAGILTTVNCAASNGARAR